MRFVSFLLILRPSSTLISAQALNPTLTKLLFSTYSVCLVSVVIPLLCILHPMKPLVPTINRPHIRCIKQNGYATCSHCITFHPSSSDRALPIKFLLQSSCACNGSPLCKPNKITEGPSKNWNQKHSWARIMQSKTISKVPNNGRIY